MNLNNTRHASWDFDLECAPGGLLILSTHEIL